MDEVVHHPTWTHSKADLVRNGFVGLRGPGRAAGPGGGHGVGAYLVCQAETAIYCGLGMTAGAADIVERYAPDGAPPRPAAPAAQPRPRRGVGGRHVPHRAPGRQRRGGQHHHAPCRTATSGCSSGDKHFCSNVDAEVFIVLARPEGAPGGTRGLATFIVPRRLPDGSPNGFTIKRLKPKLGTVGVPDRRGVARRRPGVAGRGSGDGVERHGGVRRTPADAARDGRGINRMMEMVNGSRFGVALMGLGIHRRSFLEAAIYAARRPQFGNRIDSYPLVRETLVDMLVDLEAGHGRHLRVRGGHAVGGRRRSRAAWCGASSCRWPRCAAPGWRCGPPPTALEVLAGNGYMEDWPMARQLRDAQCHTIWEGTENILCIDVRRAIRGEQAHLALFARLERALEAAAGHKVLAGAVDTVAASLADARSAVPTWRRPPTTWPCCTAGGWPSCWPTRPRGRCWSTRRRGRSTATATPARPRWPAASSARRLAAPALRGITRHRPHRARPLRADHPLRPGRPVRPGGLTLPGDRSWTVPSRPGNGGRSSDLSTPGRTRLGPWTRSRTGPWTRRRRR